MTTNLPERTDFPENTILRYSVGMLPDIPASAIILEIEMQRHDFSTGAPVPTERETLRFLISPEEAFELGSSLVFSARFEGN